MTIELTATGVRISSRLVSFGKEDGISEGTELGIDFEITGDYSSRELKSALALEKVKLDTLVLNLEYRAGRLKQSYYGKRAATFSKMKDALHGEVLEDEGE